VRVSLGSLVPVQEGEEPWRARLLVIFRLYDATELAVLADGAVDVRVSQDAR